MGFFSEIRAFLGIKKDRVEIEKTKLEIEKLKRGGREKENISFRGRSLQKNWTGIATYIITCEKEESGRALFSPYSMPENFIFDTQLKNSNKDIKDVKQRFFSCTFKQKEEEGEIIGEIETIKEVKENGKKKKDIIIYTVSKVELFPESELLSLFFRISDKGSINYAIALLQWPAEGKKLFGGFLGRGRKNKVIIGTLEMQEK